MNTFLAFALLLLLTPCQLLLAKDSTITIALDSPPQSLDSRFQSDTNSELLKGLVHCSLIKSDGSGRISPYLASSWEWLTPKSLLVKIKSAKFSNGKPVTPIDVKSIYEFLNTKENRFQNIEAIDVGRANESHVVFKLKEEDPDFVNKLKVGVIPSTQSSEGLIGFKAVVGCGPFILTAFKPGALLFGRNLNFSLAAQTKSKRLVVKIIRSEAKRLESLIDGKIDIVQNLIEIKALERISKHNPNLKVLRKTGLKTEYLAFNMKDKTTSNPDVRRAIAHGINTRQIIKFILKGLAVPAKTLLTPDSPFFKSDIPVLEYNPKLANTLLDAAGYKIPKGKKWRFELEFKTVIDVSSVAIAKAIAADLQRIGIKTKVQPLTKKNFTNSLANAESQVWNLSLPADSLGMYEKAFFSKAVFPNGENFGHFKNKKLDDIFEAARTETNSTKRIKLYRQIQSIIAKELPAVFLWHNEIFAVVSKKIKGFELYPDGQLSSLQKSYK